jgi:hypothetical protein
MKPLHDLSDAELAQWAHRALAMPDAPAAWISRAVALQPAGASPSAAVSDLLASGLRAVLATLRFDSWATPAAAFALRSGGSATRHLLFSAAGRDVDLRISPSGDGFQLSGQVLGPDDSGQLTLAYTADGHAGEAPERSTPVDEWGEFRLAGLPGGTCSLTLHLGGERIVLPPITLGEAPP